MEEKLLEIAQKLYKRTKEGSISWSLTDNDNIYQVDVSEYIIKISKEQLSVEPIFNLNIFNLSGVFLLSINSKEIETISEIPAATAMNEIYQIARRQALGVDKAIDDILKSL